MRISKENESRKATIGDWSEALLPYCNKREFETIVCVSQCKCGKVFYFNIS
jgi:hypothetical protein